MYHSIKRLRQPLTIFVNSSRKSASFRFRYFMPLVESTISAKIKSSPFPVFSSQQFCQYGSEAALEKIFGILGKN